MNKILSLLFLLSTSLLCHAHGGGNYEHSDMLASMKPGDKAALLMVHFGTTYDDTRALTIDAINAKAQAAFPERQGIHRRKYGKSQPLYLHL